MGDILRVRRNSMKNRIRRGFRRAGIVVAVPFLFLGALLWISNKPEEGSGWLLLLGILGALAFLLVWAIGWVISGFARE
jgi:hypothetical protein